MLVFENKNKNFWCNELFTFFCKYFGREYMLLILY